MHQKVTCHRKVLIETPKFVVRSEFQHRVVKIGAISAHPADNRPDRNICVFVWLNKTRTVKPLRRFHSWCLSFTQDGLAFSTKNAQKALQVQLRCVCVCCFVLLNLHWGITGPGLKPGVTGSTFITLTMLLAAPGPPSSICKRTHQL